MALPHRALTIPIPSASGLGFTPFVDHVQLSVPLLLRTSATNVNYFQGCTRAGMGFVLGVGLGLQWYGHLNDTSAVGNEGSG